MTDDTNAQGADAPDPDAALRAAQDAVDQLGDLNGIAAQAAGSASAKPLDLPSFDGKLSPSQVHALELLSDVNLNVKIELGRTRMLVEDVLRLAEGAVVELDKLAGDPVDVYVNERHVARGEVLVLNDNFCVRINEVITPMIEVSDTKGAA
ncbi:MAG TPA: flagellar motor switch protein FliN [Phycisphaerales bacterium]|nr:flagellar motor switch protein FliN [Phycisphaerales bacterium]